MRYQLLRGYFHGADDDTIHERDQARLVTITLPPGAQTLGLPLEQMALHAMGVQVVNLRRSSGHLSAPGDDTVLRAGDTLVLSGLPEPLSLAEAKLLNG